MKKNLICLALVAMLGTATGAQAGTERVKDLATISGVRANQLVGYGLVVGLDGTGDQTTQTPFAVQSMVTMLGSMGVTLPPGTNLQLKNVAAVMVTASLPAFARPGQTLDVTVSSMGNAKSLAGGTLIMTPLKGANNEVYAVAQGSLLVGGAGAEAGGASKKINHLSAGRIPGGAIVEQGVEATYVNEEAILLELKSSDFGTAAKMTEAINRRLGAGRAEALDSRTVRVRAPAEASERVRFIGQLEAVELAPVAEAAKVVVNARTGSVAMNQKVMLYEAAVAHGTLSVSIDRTPLVSQPAPFSEGETVMDADTNIEIAQSGGSLQKLPAGASLAEVVSALNALGATPADLVSILQSLKAAGALRAELEII